MIDLRPARENLLVIASNITDDDLMRPTPCPDWPIAALLDHTLGLTYAFTQAARKAPVPGGPSGTPSLPADWFGQLEERSQHLVDAWKDPAAWDGMAEAGGVAMPADIMGVVVLDELTLHAWDLAAALSQDVHVPKDDIEVLLGFTGELAAPGAEASRDGLFGPVVPLEGASGFDRVLSNAGRDPYWTPVA